MAKVSIGLRGWRFDETDVFDETGNLRPIDDMPKDVARRVTRLSILMGAPCNACWLLHGDDNLDKCNSVDAVYGEPLAEIVLCTDHEADFLYWYQELGGDTYRGDDEFQDAFFEWFANDGRAPPDYDGIQHIDTDPDALPEPPKPTIDTQECVGDPTEKIDLHHDYPSK